MGDLELLFALLFAAVLLVRAADHVGVPYPIVLVLGRARDLVRPGHAAVELDAHVVLLVFIPPLLLSAGWSSSPRELRAESRALGLLALALVLVTTAVVAVAAHELVAGLTWPAAFMLGAVVAPTDAVAAVATFASVRVPERVKLLVQGESLINDAHRPDRVPGGARRGRRRGLLRRAGRSASSCSRPPAGRSSASPWRG